MTTSTKHVQERADSTTYDERVQKILERVEGNRVLHVGACGNRRVPKDDPHFLQEALVRAGFSVLATDINERGIEWLREIGYEAAYLDATDIPADGEKFDTVVAGELIEHLSNPGQFIEGVASRLVPGGVLVLSTPQPFSPLFFLLYLVRPGYASNAEHACWYDVQTLRQALRRYGFVTESVTFVDDHRTENRSAAFRTFARAWRVLRRVLPSHLRTTMVVAARYVGEEGVKRDLQQDRAHARAEASGAASWDR